jgi:hypothetical protein
MDLKGALSAFDILFAGGARGADAPIDVGFSRRLNGPAAIGEMKVWVPASE